MPLIPTPNPAAHGPFSAYLRLVPNSPLLPYLDTQRTTLLALLSPLSDPQALTLHAPYTWSIKQVLGHISDTERIFAARALRIARNDPTPLPGFHENPYVEAANFNALPLQNLLHEFNTLRLSNLVLFQNFPEVAWTREGTASNTPLTPAALAHAIAGHTQHHLLILQKRLAT